MNEASDHDPLNDDEPVETPPSTARSVRRPRQFRISTLISWTTVIIVMLVSSNAARFIAPDGGNIFRGNLSDLFFAAVVICLFMFPALTCIPILIDKLLDKQHGLEFGAFTDLWMTVCIGLHSIVSIMLATVAFAPEWKGQKGNSWLFYLLDDAAGLTLWPIYIVGAVLFAAGLWNPKYAKESPAVLVAVVTNAGISLWYVLAVLLFNFAHGPIGIIVVPAACGVCYTMYAILIWRHHQFRPILRDVIKLISGWFAFLTASILLKIPLAIRFYENLPDEPPEGCFVVTAATKGHPLLVGSWFDDSRSRILNQQLMTFWSFENLLKKNFPRFHGVLRAAYNRVGPIIARQIRFRWQADLMYCFLKPLEWIARLWVSNRER